MEEERLKRLREFDPENPTLLNLPLPWLVKWEGETFFGVSFAEEIPEHLSEMPTSDGADAYKLEFELLPLSQWPLILVEQYCSIRRRIPSHFPECNPVYK